MKTVVRARSIGILTLFLLSIENALALSTGLSPLDTAFNTIGNLFSINALQNEQVAVGVARFLWFVLIFAVLNWSGRNYVFKGDDGTNKKTANIVALVLAAISVFFVPMNVILAGTSGWGVILWSILLLAPALVAVKFAFGGSKEKSAGDHIVDFVILLFALLWTWLMMGTLLEWYREQFPQTANSIDSVVGVAWLVLFFALLWKFFQIIGASGGSLGKAGSGIGSLFNRSGNGTNTPKSPDEKRPSRPTGLAGELVPKRLEGTSKPAQEILLWWNDNAPEEGVQRYEVMYQQYPKYGIGYTGTTGWHKLGSAQSASKEHPFTAMIPDKAMRNIAISKKGAILVSVQAVNHGGKSFKTKAYIYQRVEQRKFDLREINKLLKTMQHIMTSTRTLQSLAAGYAPALAPIEVREGFATEAHSYQNTNEQLQQAFGQIFQSGTWSDAVVAEKSEILTLFDDYVRLDAQILAQLKSMEERA